MAKELKKPKMIKEGDLKEYAGDVIIDVTPRKEPPRPVAPLVRQKDVAQLMATAAQPNPVADPKMMPFGVWFQKQMMNRPSITFSYKEAIEAHCKALGLGPQAPEEDYDNALVHFGL